MHIEREEVPGVEYNVVRSNSLIGSWNEIYEVHITRARTHDDGRRNSESSNPLEWHRRENRLPFLERHGNGNDDDDVDEENDVNGRKRER